MSQGAKAAVFTALGVLGIAAVAATLVTFGVQVLFYYGIVAALCGVAGLAWLVRPR